MLWHASMPWLLFTKPRCGDAQFHYFFWMCSIAYGNPQAACEEAWDLLLGNISPEMLSCWFADSHTAPLGTWKDRGCCPSSECADEDELVVNTYFMVRKYTEFCWKLAQSIIVGPVVYRLDAMHDIHWTFRHKGLVEPVVRLLTHQHDLKKILSLSAEQGSMHASTAGTVASSRHDCLGSVTHMLFTILFNLVTHFLSELI